MKALKIENEKFHRLQLQTLEKFSSIECSNIIKFKLNYIFCEIYYSVIAEISIRKGCTNT